MIPHLLLSGTANEPLARAVAAELGTRLGQREIERFPDGELSVHLQESVRGREVFLLQPTSPPVNDHLIELFAFADACRRASAARITAIIPYFGYARGDRRGRSREPIMASLVAELIQASGIDHVLLLDVHAAQMEGFFRIPVDSLTAVPLLCDALRGRLPEKLVVVSPDTGRVAMATEYAHLLGTRVVVLHKRRGSGTETEITHVVGEVNGQVCVIIDDMIATGGTVIESVHALREAGAREEFYVVATHGLLIGEACMRFADAGVRRVFVTDSVLPRLGCDTPLQVITIAPLLASAVRHELESAPR